jgi:hypothetical protein
MEQVCDKLLETFDTNELDNKDKMIQAAFYSQAQKFKDTDKDNTLFRLIRNHYDSKIEKPIAQFIGGPFVVRNMYNKKHNINIYLFGEFHSNNIDCPKNNFELIENYLDKLIRNTDVFLDLYFEFPGFLDERYLKSNVMSPQRMQELFLKFYKCIQTVSRTSDECQLSRIHYIDVRKFEKLYSGYGNIAFLSRKLLEKMGNIDLLSSDKNWSKILFVLNKLKLPLSDYNKFWQEEIEDHKFIRKELERSYLGNQILGFMKKRIVTEASFKKENIKETINKLLEIETKTNKKQKDKTELFKLYHNLDKFLVNPLSVIIDAYTLARMFKNFKVKNKLNQPEKPHNIIYYAGGAHTLNIFKCLINLEFKQVEKSGNFFDDNIDNYIGGENKYQNCIDMEPIQQPLFSNI